MQSARPRTLRIFSSSALRIRNSGSACGGGPLTMPTEAILRSVLSIRRLRLQIWSAVGQIERLVDEREVGNDVTEDGVLDCRPVLPRRIMRMTAADRSAGTCFQGDEYRAAPSLDESNAKRTGFGHTRCRHVRAGWQCGQHQPHEPARLRELVESDRNARGHVALGPNDLGRRQFIVGPARQIDARIEPLATRSSREPQHAEARGERRRQYARCGEAIAKPRMIVEDGPKLLHFSHDRSNARRERRRGLPGEVCPSAARYDRIEEISLPERALDLSQQFFLDPRELRQRERKSRVVPERAQVTQVIGQTLELQAERTQPDGTVRYRPAGHAFQRLTVGPRERDGAIARDARR